MRNKTRRLGLSSLRLALLAGAAVAPSVAAAKPKPPPPPVTFADLTTSLGITYKRAPSTTIGTYDAVKIKPFVSNLENNQIAGKHNGAPGIAVLDFDGDGDQDIFVTNGPGRPNSLYKNLLTETGSLAFVDVGAAAGLAATDMDATGTCYGDIDNDGDPDILVLGRMEDNRLFRNNGDGTFTEITSSAGVGGGPLGHTHCSMGDVDGDGLIDIFVANTYDWTRQDAIFTNAFSFNHHNQLYVNRGGNVFEDVSVSSGMHKLQNVPPGDATITWAAALVDYDQDGDLDIILADDQGAFNPGIFAGLDRGLIQIFQNDGTGKFTNVTSRSGDAMLASSWMGLSFGDVNSDGHLDMFATNVGDYLVQQYGIPTPPGYSTSRWFLGAADGKFQASANPGDPGPLGGSPFGWSTAMFDYDNDGDTDIAFYGAMDIGPFITADNPGVILSNDGNANFTWDRAATLSSAEKVQRSQVNSMAIGDLNNDGFFDIVHVSGHYVGSNMPIVPWHQKWGGPFDQVAFYAPAFMPIGPFEWEWAGRDPEEGPMGVQISSASNGNGWVKIGVQGTKDLTNEGKVNRDGIGAIIKFTPKKGKQAMVPVLAGSGHAGQHSMIQGFGLGTAKEGDLEVFWPGGVSNRLYKVEPGETVTMPEIPCDFRATYPGGKKGYEACVNGALNQLFFRGAITADFANRLRDSAKKAWSKK